MAWAVQGPMQRPPATQLIMPSGQAVSGHGPWHRPVAGSQFGKASARQSSWSLQRPKQRPVAGSQFGSPGRVQSALSLQGPKQRPSAPQLGVSGGQSAPVSQRPKQRPSAPQFGMSSGHA
jgi:hypothetical protein